MALFNASSATVRAVSQVWANGIMFLMKYVVGLDYRVEGRENVPDGPCIIACNHQSLWETAALCVIFPDASIVAKKELRKLPLVGWFLERYPMILVDRSAGRQALRQMVDEAKRAVGEGRKVLLFPQGTRQAIDEPVTFQSAGISALYTNLDVPVVPAACNSGLFWGKKTLMMHSRHHHPVFSSADRAGPAAQGVSGKDGADDRGGGEPVAYGDRGEGGALARAATQPAKGERNARHQMNCAAIGATEATPVASTNTNTGNSAVTIE